MTNPHTRWNHSKVFKSILCPLQQLVTLSVSTVLHLHILFIGVVCSVIVDLNRMVDNQVHRNGWIDLCPSPPCLTYSDRSAAISTTVGTPVKSCIKMREGLKGISISAGSGDQWSRALICSSVILNPS